MRLEKDPDFAPAAKVYYNPARAESCELPREGVEQPSDAHADHHEQRKGPYYVFDPPESVFLHKTRERQRNQERKTDHRPEVAEMHHTSRGLTPPADCDFVRIKHAQQIHDSRSGDEAGAIVARGARNVGTGRF